MRYNSNCACSSVELERNPPKVEVTRLNRVKRTNLRKNVLIKRQDFFIKKFRYYLIKNNSLFRSKKYSKILPLL